MLLDPYREMPAAIVTGAVAGNGLAFARRLRVARHTVIALDRACIPDAAAHTLIRKVLDELLLAAAFDGACAAGSSVFLVNNTGIPCEKNPSPT